MSKEIGRKLTELRRSSAASPQNRRHELTAEEEIKEQLDTDSNLVLDSKQEEEDGWV